MEIGPVSNNAEWNAQTSTTQPYNEVNNDVDFDSFLNITSQKTGISKDTPDLSIYYVNDTSIPVNIPSPVPDNTEISINPGKYEVNSPPGPTAFDSIINEMSQKYQVDVDLIKKVVQTESNFNPKAISHAGAMGLMQLMPRTAEGLGVKDPFDPRQNIEGGVKYLRNMLDRYNNDTKLALAAYNAGPGNVDKHGDVPPFKETQNYVKKILG